MSFNNRIGAIDIFKSIVIIAIIFLNVLNMHKAPDLMQSAGSADGSIIAWSVVCSLVIFLAGMTIPFYITKMINQGLSSYDIIRSVFARSVILITVGVLLVNTSRVNSELTGLSSALWSVLLFTAIFLVWNRYSEKENNFFTTSGLRLIGLAALVFLVFKFKSGSYENNGSLIPGWWEIPGLTGWAFLVAGLTYVAFRNSVSGTVIMWLIFLALAILNYLGFTGFLDPVRPYFGVLLNGYIPFLILSGQLTSLLLKKMQDDNFRSALMILPASGAILAGAGIFLLINSFPGAVFGNPSWALIISGGAIMVFTLLFWLDEVVKVMTFTLAIKPFGANLFTIYILNLLMISYVHLLKMNIFSFLDQKYQIFPILGSAAWTIIVLVMSLVLFRFNIRLRF